MASFLYCFPYSYRSSNYCDSNICRSFTLLKALAKSKCNLFAIAWMIQEGTTFDDDFYVVVGKQCRTENAISLCKLANALLLFICLKVIYEINETLLNF